MSDENSCTLRSALIGPKVIIIDIMRKAKQTKLLGRSINVMSDLPNFENLHLVKKAPQGAAPLSR
jgi:hypothetical protein